MDVKCPVCGERQIGENVGELETVLQDHLAETHLMAAEEDKELSFHCPLCETPVKGRDEEDITSGLRDHFFEIHNMEPSKIRLRD